MFTLLCLFGPPLLLVAFRERIYGCEPKRQVQIWPLLQQYCISTLLLNFASIIVTHLVFHHEEGLVSSLNQYMEFSFHYLLLQIVFACIFPFAEYFIRFHLHIIPPPPIRYSIKNQTLYLYALILFALHFIRIFDNSFWGDEGFSIRLAKMSISQMLEVTANDVHPPLYYFLAMFLYRVLGNHGYTYHLSAVLPYALILLVSCTFVRKRFGALTAAILVTLSALSKSAITYNVEVRMYALAALFVLIAYLALYQIYQRGTFLDWSVFCVASLGAAYTHYYALISVAFFYLMLLPLLFRTREYLWKILVAYIVTIIGYLPWLFILLASFQRTANGWWLSSVSSARDFYQFIFDSRWLQNAFIVVVAFYFVQQIISIQIKKDPSRKPFDRFDVNLIFISPTKIPNDIFWILAGLLSFIGTVGIGLAASKLIRPLILLRYIFPVAPVLYLILGYCISKLPLRRTVAILVLLGILRSGFTVYASTFQYEKFTLDAETTQCLQTVAPAEDTLLLTNNDHLGWNLLEYYYPQNPHGNCTSPLDCLDDAKNADVILFWDSEIDEEALNAIRVRGYVCKQLFEGHFANGAYYHVYKLQTRARAGVAK